MMGISWTTRITSISYFMVLLLVLGCHKATYTGVSWASAGSVGEDDAYKFHAAARQLTDGSIHASPLLIWRHDTPTPDVTIECRNNRWSLVWGGSERVEHRGTSVLVYEGPGKPLRELAPRWESRYIKTPESFRNYVESCLLGEAKWVSSR